MEAHAYRTGAIDELRSRIAGVASAARAGGTLAFDVPEIDERLADRGLSRSALHEVAAATSTLADDTAATLFSAGAAARMAQGDGQVLWAVTRFDLYAPGLEQAGLGPASVLFAEVREDRDVLAVMEDALRQGSLAAVVGEVRRVDMTSLRRLQLAAAEGRTAALLLRRWRRAGTCPLSEPSAATTRWRIGCAPTASLGMPGVGRARWTVELARQRNGAPFTLTMEGCDAQGRLALPAAAADRAVAAGGAAPRARPEPPPLALPVDDDPGTCSAPRGGGWRPGARWAQADAATRAAIAAEIEALPSHRRPPARELGRRSEAAEHPFRAMRPDEGGRAPAPRDPTPGAANLPPLVLAATVGRRQEVAAACPAAMALGLTPGLALTYARALVPGLDVRRSDPEADAAVLLRLAIHAARHWTPMARPDADGLWLDLTGTTHLFGGEERFCRRVARFLGRAGLTVRIAVADTPGAAHALARFGRATIEIVPAGGSVQAVAPLPVKALRLEPGALAACRRFGIERVADLLPMPRGPVTRRLGREAVVRLDQAVGRVAEPIEPVVPDDPPTVERRLLEPVGTPESIGQIIGDLVADLAHTLRERGLGVRSATLTLLRVDGGEQRIIIGASRATRDAAHIAKLMLLRLDTVDPGLGIEVGRLVATRTEPLGATELGTELVGDTRPADLAPLVDQLAGRVGERALFRASLVESDVPERAVGRVAALDEARGWPAWRRPARLLARPEPLSNVVALLPDHPPRRFSWRGNRHVIVAGDGPERIHGEWWLRDGEVWAVRDYFRVEDESGGRYWVFRRGDGVDGATGDLSWWMHGAFG